MYPLGFTNIAGWNITMFNRKCIDSIRGPHFPASYVRLPKRYQCLESISRWLYRHHFGSWRFALGQKSQKSRPFWRFSLTFSQMPGGYTTHLCGDYVISHYKDPGSQLTNQDSIESFFFFCGSDVFFFSLHSGIKFKKSAGWKMGAPEWVDVFLIENGV